MKDFWIILDYIIKEYKNCIFYGNGINPKRIGFVLIILLGPLIIWGNACLSYVFFKQINKVMPVHILLNIFAFALFGIFGFCASSNIYMTMKLVFKSPYFESLIPLPVTGKTLFFVKLFEVLFRNYMDIFFSMPVLLAFAYTFKINAVGILTIFFLFFVFELFISSLILAFIMAAVRYLSRRTAENIVWVFNVFFILFFIILQNLPSSYLENNTGTNGIARLFSVFSSPAFEFLPTKWLLWFIYYLANADFYHSFIYLTLIILLFLLTIRIALRLFETGYINGWQKQTESDCLNLAPSDKKNMNFPCSMPFIALIKRELKMLFRTKEIFMSFFIMPVVFVMFNIFNISFGGMNPFSFLLLTIYICVLSSTIYGFGLEGSGIYFLKSLPVSINRIFLAKYFVYVALNILIAAFCISFSYYTANFPGYLRIENVLMIMVFAEIWLNLIVMDFGFLFANFKNTGKLKESISLAGNVSLTAFLISFWGCLIWAFFEEQLLLCYVILLFMFIIEYFIHHQAVMRYAKGEV